MNTTELIARPVRNWVEAVMRTCDYCSHHKMTVLNSDGSAICASCSDAEYVTNLLNAVEIYQARNAELVEALESAQEIRAAAEKLVRCKGRYHSEQNYRALAALFGVTTPDLPPMSEEAQTVVVSPPAYVDGNTLGYGEVNHMIDLCVDSFERACHAVGIKCEVKVE